MIDENIKNWLQKADNDLTTAKHELDLPTDETVKESVCFHSQQAAEKLLKAFLISKNEEFGKTHNLELLLQLCAKHDKDFLKCELGELTEYPVGIRYPGDFFEPDIQETKLAYKIANNIKTFVNHKLNI